jgi:hypothetical protein
MTQITANKTPLRAQVHLSDLRKTAHGVLRKVLMDYLRNWDRNEL